MNNNLTKKSLLIVEDNLMNMDIASTLLKLAGWHVFESTDGFSCLEIAKQHQPKLILMDMHLPIMDGFEICKILKSDPLTANITIIAFTALAMDHDQKKALASGCAGVISKPIDVEHFVDEVNSYMT